MKRTTTDTTTATDQALVTAAGKGDEAAFAELHRRHAPLAWRLALAITGDPDLAARAVADGTGTVFTALRVGRFQAHPHGVSLAGAVRNTALDLRRDGATTSPVVADDADALLAGAFAGLPERWRSVLWLRDAEAQDAQRVAPVVELTPEATDQLAVRARRGLRERYLRAQAATTSARACTRAVARLGALDDGTLAERDTAMIERHLASCPACADRRTRVAGLGAALPQLALPAPADLQERAQKAWTAALATTTRTGLSPRTEKVLAGASAFAAALGVLGAALFGSGGGDEPTASPLAPLVADIETPRPVDLSEVALPLLAPPPVAGADALDRRSLPGAVRSTPTAPASPAPVAAPGAPTAPATPGTPAAEGPTSPTPELPVGIDPEEGVTVGPVTVDPTPDDDGGTLQVDGAEPLAPVIDAANEVLDPAVEATEPATTPLLEAMQPVTDAVTSVVGRLGL